MNFPLEVFQGIYAIAQKIESMGSPRGAIVIQPYVSTAAQQIQHSSILHLPPSVLRRPLAEPALVFNFYQEGKITSALESYNKAQQENGKPELSFADLFAKMEAYDPKEQVFVAVVPPETGLKGEWLSILSKEDLKQDLIKLRQSHTMMA